MSPIVRLVGIMVLLAGPTAMLGGQFDPPNGTVASFSSQPASQTVSAGATATFSVSVAGLSQPTRQWQFNGIDVAGATALTLPVTNVQPASAGIYRVRATNETGSALSAPAILGLASTSKVIGAGTEIAANILHPAGFIFDQVLLDGAAATVTADAGQLTRISYIDANDDIVMIDFKGAGALTIALAAATGPAAPVKYNQPTASYMKGHAGLVITGANETTEISISTVGRVTAVNQSIFKDDVVYDGVADIAFIAISSANGQCGAVRAANARFSAASGLTGIFAPGVQFTGPVLVYDIAATATAQPVMIFGAASDVRVAGGDLLQANGQPVLTAGLVSPSFTAGADSHGVVLPALTNQGQFLQINLAEPPTLSQPPANVAVAPGGSATFSVTPAGTGPFTFQWRKTQTTVVLGTGSTFTLNNLAAADAGGYEVIVGNAFGTLRSGPVGLAVIPLGAMANPIGSTLPGTHAAFDRAFLGARYTLTSPLTVTTITAHVAYSNNLNMFAAIVRLPNATGFPTASATTGLGDLGEVMFSTLFNPGTLGPEGALVTIPVSANLAAGSYAVVFGAGLFGSPVGASGGLRQYETVAGSDSIGWVKPVTEWHASEFDLIAGAVPTYAVSLNTHPTEFPTALRVDPAFAPVIEANGGTVNTIARQPDGKLVVGGTFSRINGVARRNLARLNVDGSVDTVFNPGLGPDGPVLKVLLQPDGKVLLAGDFSRFGNATRGRIARANADGSLDSTFAPGEGASASVSSLALQSDGKIVVVGQFNTYDGVNRGHITRVHPGGSHDLTFNPGTGTSGIAMDVTVLADGRILVVGPFAQYNETPRDGMARVLADGSLDPTFVPVMEEGVDAWTLALQPDGKILVGANSFLSSAPNLLRLNADGSRDTGFNAIALRGVFAIAVQADGAIVAGGTFGTYNGALRTHVVRLTATGALDSTYNTGAPPDFQTFALVLLPNGQVVAGGRFFPQAEGSTQSALARLGTTGTVDATFAGDVRSPGTVLALVPQSDGKLLIGGKFDYVNGVSRRRIARVMTDGSLDMAFNPVVSLAGGSPSVEAIALQSDGKILVGGFFDLVNSSVRGRIVRLLPDGLVDASFDPGAGASASVLSIALQTDGKILLGGFFSTYGGVARNRIARINANGTLDPTFDPGAGADSLVFAIAVQPDGRVVLGGWFNNYNGVSRPGMARAMPDGSLDGSFVPGYTDFASIDEFLLEPDGKVYVGGYNRVVRLNANGSLDAGFPVNDLAIVGGVGAITKQTDGRLLVGQAVASSTSPRPIGFARVNTDGTRDNSFALVGMQDVHVSNIRLLDEGALLVAGEFFSDGTTSQAGLARLVRVSVATIATQPANQAVVAGGTITLSVSASGVGPFTYEWRKNGTPIGGATSATFTIGSVTAGNAGDYTVAVTNPGGTTLSDAATLTVLPAVAPAITAPPQSQAVSEGASFTLGVGVTGSAPLSYQWRLNGGDIAGATGTTFTVASAQSGDAGDYTVFVSNAGGNVTSAAATITVIPAGFGAAHALVGPGYVAGGTVTVTNTIHYSGTLPALGWRVLLPAGWTFESDAGTGGPTHAPTTHPNGGDTSFIEYSWDNPPASGATFSYTLGVPEGTTGPQTIAALMLPRQSSTQYTLLVKPDPLVIDKVTYHSADTGDATGIGTPDSRISLTELLRVIELYNTRKGTVRTGAYAVDPTNTEDGFATAPARSLSDVVTLARYHSADTGDGQTSGAPRDGKLQLTELLRVIELYNYRSGTVRTGEYHVSITTEDGFASGP